MRHVESDVKFIWNSLSDFWRLFKDKDIVEQVWRGFIQALKNLYYQLYQTNLSKSIDTIPYQWLSDWEPINLTKENQVDPVDNDWPYCYKLPDGLKDITYLVESPRNGIRMPAGSELIYKKQDDGSVISFVKYPDGSQRPFKTVLLEDTSDDDRYLVASQCFKKDSDFRIIKSASNELLISFRAEINSIMWAHLAVRDSYFLYETFGYLLRFFKEDSMQYLRELQGLWISYLSSPTPASLSRGLTILRSLPFALDTGVIQNVSSSPSELRLRHTRVLYAIPADTDTTTIDPRNLVVNSLDHYILTPFISYQANGETFPISTDVTLQATSFLHAGLRTNDYIFRLDESNQTATFSFSRLEKTHELTSQFFQTVEADTITRVYKPDEKHVSFFIGNRQFVLPDTFPTPSHDAYILNWDETSGSCILSDHTIIQTGAADPGFDRLALPLTLEEFSNDGNTISLRFSSGVFVAVPAARDHKRLDMLSQGLEVSSLDGGIHFNNNIIIPLSKKYLSPIQEGQVVSDIVLLDSESYVELDNVARIFVSDDWARLLLESGINHRDILKIEGVNVTFGSLVNIKLTEEEIYQVTEGDVIDYISPAILNITLNDTEYTYHTDSDPIVSVGQYIEKFTPLVDSVRILDWVRNPKWMFSAYGIAEEDVKLSSVLRDSLFDYTSRNMDDGLVFDAGFSPEALNILAQKYHTFLASFDEASIPTDYEALNLILTFIRLVKPTYVDSNIIMSIGMEDDLVVRDNFLPMEAEYEWQENYPWKNHHFAVFDDPNASFDTDLYFDEASDADDLDIYAVMDTDLSENYWGDRLIYFDSGIDFDCNPTDFMDSDTGDDLTLTEEDHPDIICPDKTIKIGRGLSFIIKSFIGRPSTHHLIIDTKQNQFILDLDCTHKGDGIYVLSHPVQTSSLRQAISATLVIEDTEIPIEILDFSWLA